MGHLMRDHRREPVQICSPYVVSSAGPSRKRSPRPGDAERTGGIDLHEIDLPRRIRAEPLVVVAQGIAAASRVCSPMAGSRLGGVQSVSSVPSTSWLSGA